MPKIILRLTIALTLSVGIAAAQSYHCQMSGVVVDTNGAVVPNVGITVRTVNLAPITVTTDSGGEFDITDGPCSSDLSTEMKGFSPHNETVTANPRTRVHKIIILRVAASDTPLHKVEDLSELIAVPDSKSSMKISYGLASDRTQDEKAITFSPRYQTSRPYDSLDFVLVQFEDLALFAREVRVSRNPFSVLATGYVLVDSPPQRPFGTDTVTLSFSGGKYSLTTAK